MATRQAHKRLTKEYKAIIENPPQFINAQPNEDNILEWHYIITGPPDTPYTDGQYHGTLVFPADYPFKPPAIRMITPNGRFKENTRLCMTMSDYHPDTWNPAWSVATILMGLLSFMTGDEVTTGSITTSDAYKKKMAKKSKEYNALFNARFKAVFPDLAKQNLKDIEEAKQKQKQEDADEEKKKNFLEEAAKEQVVHLADIKDPEDRIRAEQELERSAKLRNNKKDRSSESNSSWFYVLLAITVFFIGLFMK